MSDICKNCEGSYKCDTGYGENRTRYLVDGECPVCDSDPHGDHREWFENYCGYNYEEEEEEEEEEEGICLECGWKKDSYNCQCCDDCGYRDKHNCNCTIKSEKDGDDE